MKEQFGAPADVIVNSAGITRDGYLLKMTEDQFDQVIDINLKGTFNVNQVFSRVMKEHNVQHGSIVNIASVVGKISSKTLLPE